ncbi:hypothetical protein WCQ02_36545 [Paraburkholderia tropica]|uniref:hypothetical protein n=1 Tax=Paraburkholderia tropica TaxID=92647 RepID=UPI0015711178|nr:hypothetical protein [Paraburkholderia tropica]
MTINAPSASIDTPTFALIVKPFNMIFLPAGKSCYRGKENFIYGDLRQKLKKSLGFVPIRFAPVHIAASGSAIA